MEPPENATGVTALLAQIRKMPEGFGGVEHRDVTNIHPAGMAAIAVLGGAMLAVPRRYAVIPVLVMACIMSPVQKIVVLGLDFNMIRLMVLAGWIRVLVRGEYQGFRWCLLDKVLIAFAVSGTIIYTLQQGNGRAFVYKLGTSYDAVGGYFVLRCLIRSWDDVFMIARGLAVLSLPVLAVFLVERSTGRNMFSALGGVPEITRVRDGKLRCQGPFPHAIMAGCFWATQIPLILALWWKSKRDRLFAVAGASASLAIVICTASSTPLAGLGAVLVGMAFYPLRESMRTVRWAVGLGLVGLHMVMNKPVWHLIGRIDLVGGSTGYHRYRLIDTAINRVGEWGLLGTRSTAHWGWGLQDVTNQYILEGVRGGLVTMCLFFTAIAIAFGCAGRARSLACRSRSKEPMAWALGVTLFAHCMCFLAVSYFGQITVIWYMLLAGVGSVSAMASTSPLWLRRSSGSVPRTAHPKALVHTR